METSTIAHPPATLEGWYALHQIFRVDGSGISNARFEALLAAAHVALSRKATGASKRRKTIALNSGAGWSCVVKLIGSTSQVMVVHFRDSLDAIGAAQTAFDATNLRKVLEPVYAFLSVTEAGLYHITADLARQAEARGGKVGDEQFARALAERSDAELSSAHIQRRLYPEIPDGMPYVCFYPMSKRRNDGQNWYTLSLDERSRLMQAHGMTGRRYAGKVQQVITGAIGLDAWEWGVTLFASDPLQFKKLVTDMRFDEVSAKYADFGSFFVGKIVRG
jgi:hydrogen peroxide-dependent heme synthase